MNILLLSHNYPKKRNDRRDAGIFVADFFDELSNKQNVFVQNISSQTGEKFGEWSIFNPFSVTRFIKMLFVNSNKVNKYIITKKIDFVLAFWALPAGILAYINFLRNKTPYAIWCLGSDLNKYAKYPILRKLLILSLKNATVRYANSHALCNLGKKLTGRDFIFLPAVTKFKYDIDISKNKNNYLSNEFFKILFVGRLEKVKGVDILIDSIKIIKEKIKKKIIVNILGDGSQRDRLRRLCIKNNISDCVQFHGFADLNKVSNFMRNSDCLVISSRSESLPLVMIEAAKSNLPIIASDVGDCKLIINKYNVGMVFNSGNVVELGRELRHMINRKNNKSVFRKGLMQMAKDFTPQKAVSIFVKQIKS